MSNEDTVRITVALSKLGFDPGEISALRRISRTLQRWAELECGDGNNYSSWAIERDEETEKPYFVRYPHDGKSYRTPIADREAGALKRLGKIMAEHKRLVSYHQTDPRGCALYIIRKADIPEGTDVLNYSSYGMAVSV